MIIYRFIAIFSVIFFLIGANIVHSDETLMTVPKIIKEAKSTISEVTVEDIKNDIDSGKSFILLDVRTAEEFNAGHLPDSINIPRGVIEFLIEKKYPVKETNIVLYCRTDSRAALCTKTLNAMGYTNARNLNGGFKAWGEAGYPIYNRHGEFKMVAFEKKE
jgi:rhodanese-related sulfurtransferase